MKSVAEVGAFCQVQQRGLLIPLLDLLHHYRREHVQRVKPRGQPNVKPREGKIKLLARDPVAIHSSGAAIAAIGIEEGIERGLAQASEGLKCMRVNCKCDGVSHVASRFQMLSSSHQASTVKAGWNRAVAWT